MATMAATLIAHAGSIWRCERSRARNGIPSYSVPSALTSNRLAATATAASAPKATKNSGDP